MGGSSSRGSKIILYNCEMCHNRITHIKCKTCKRPTCRECSIELVLGHNCEVCYMNWRRRLYEPYSKYFTESEWFQEHKKQCKYPPLEWLACRSEKWESVPGQSKDDVMQRLCHQNFQF